MPELPTFADFEESIGISFTDKRLLMQAFTHRSYLNEHRDLTIDHNERLEFLGDAVLELVSTEFLYKAYPKKSEGELTSIRAAVVNTTSISDTAKELGMNEYLLLSRGEAKDTGRARAYILANTFEAVVGAIYLDQGYAGAEFFITKYLLGKIDSIVKENLWQDAKSLFQEKAQERAGVTPSYRTLSEVGPDHQKQFTVGVFLGEKVIARGEGFSKQEAEQNAARAALIEEEW